MVMYIKRNVLFPETNHVVCVSCIGKGHITYGCYDPVEGSKTQTKMKCHTCDGYKTFNILTLMGKQAVAYWEVYLEVYEREEIREKALKKLTNKEREVLGL